MTVASTKPFMFQVVRIPKSGSSTLREMMRRAFPNSRVFTLPDEKKISAWDNLDAISHALLTRYRRLVVPYGSLTLEGAGRTIARKASPGDMISGHVSYRTLAIPGWKLRPVTLIRHPFDRTISFYNYFRGNYEKKGGLRRNARSGIIGAAGRRTLEDFVEYFWDHRARFEEMSCRMIADTKSSEEAQRVLKDEYAVYGTLETLGGFAEELSRVAQCKVEPLKVNLTSRRTETELTAKARSRIEQMFENDLKLHEAVTKEFS